VAHTKFGVEVLTPEGEVFNEEVEMVSTRTVIGSIGILANHEPLLAMLDPTELRLYRSESDIVHLAQGEGYLQMIDNHALILVEGQLRFDEFSDAWRLAARRLSDLDEALSAQARRIVIRWPTALAPKAFDELSRVLTRYRPGPCPVTIEYRAASASGALTLGTEWNVRPTRELLMALEELAGHGGVELRCAAAAPPGAGADSLADALRRP